ncbi:hypothetical protein TUM19329_20110 [Legionella antarctica]|uniref:F-box domain-containing protein n=1 Tax=Legionella antarctica TaxID=2708020 RepID=A0A6F8T674_9GAMM|nr:hypothetical protein [Legionella antarctica]BCA95650.1 hypothetical protein TUM19329_20110 [Legionella antarctica]
MPFKSLPKPLKEYILSLLSNEDIMNLFRVNRTMPNDMSLDMLFCDFTKGGYGQRFFQELHTARKRMHHGGKNKSDILKSVITDNNILALEYLLICNLVHINQSFSAIMERSFVICNFDKIPPICFAALLGKTEIVQLMLIYQANIDQSENVNCHWLHNNPGIYPINFAEGFNYPFNFSDTIVPMQFLTHVENYLKKGVEINELKAEIKNKLKIFYKSPELREGLRHYFTYLEKTDKGYFYHYKQEEALLLLDTYKKIKEEYLVQEMDKSTCRIT